MPEFLAGDPYITDHAYVSRDGTCGVVVGAHPGTGEYYYCEQKASAHVNPGDASKEHLINTHPHPFVPQANEPSLCDYEIDGSDLESRRVCGYPEQLHKWAAYDRYMQQEAEARAIEAGEDPAKVLAKNSLVRMADVAQYERPPMPEAARKGPVVTLIDAPVDPLGTLAVIGGIYTGKVRRSKNEVTDDERRGMLEDMLSTVLSGPLECIQFTFLVEGVSRSITHQMVRNRFSFFAQESLRFAVVDDWAQEVPLPPSLAGAREDSPAVGLWRKAMNAAEDAYAALVGAGMPAEEARGVLPHDITTRLYWTVSLRTLLQEAGKRTCTQAQFPWRAIFGGVAAAFRSRAQEGENVRQADGSLAFEGFLDNWQYEEFARLIRPVCYQQGRCGFMAKFDRGCTIRERVDAFERAGVASSDWGMDHLVKGSGHEVLYAIDPREWAADPGAARVTDHG